MLCGVASGLYFKGSTRDISLVPHSQEHEK